MTSQFAMQDIRAAAGHLSEQLIAWRRDFHQHPELGFHEYRTARVITDQLRQLDIEVTTGIGKTGVVGILEGDNLDPDAPTVLLRFDMDALPVHEQTDLPFRSQTEGVMHACGHDGHMAIGLGVATLLSQMRATLHGRVKLVFQPAEEGLGGAKAMIEDGVMNDPIPSSAFGLHIWSRLPLNQVVVQSGPLWANTDMFELTVYGVGGHGAVPQETVDSTVVACQIVLAWQTIVSRNVDPTETAVLSVGTLHSGTRNNIISSGAKLTGTLRTFNPEIEGLLRKRMDEIADGVCRAFGATYDLQFPIDIPVVINSKKGARLMQRVAEGVVGAGQVTEIRPMMVGEDMSEFLNRAPGCFVLLGASDLSSGLHSPHHSPTFDFDERVLPTGVALIAAAALEYLHEESATKLGT